MTRDREDDPTAATADPITWEAIRKRAYELWERNHRPAGFEIEFWLLAERELKAERRARREGFEPQRAADAGVRDP